MPFVSTRLLAVVLVLASAPLAATSLDAALDESQRLLEARNRIYSRADSHIDTSGKTLKQSLTELRNALT